MLDLSDIIQAAHGGDAVGNIAAKFGISPEQANEAINALTPALSQGLQAQTQDPQGLSQILGHLNDPAHQAAYTDAAAAQDPAATSAGGGLLNQIFGESGVSQIVEHLAATTGVSPQILAQLAPIVASMAMGGVAKTMQANGYGDVLGKLGGGAAGQAADQAGASGGGIGGLIGNVLGSLFGHGAPANDAGTAAAAPGGLDPALVEAGMNALKGMFQSGTASSSLQDILGQVLKR